MDWIEKNPWIVWSFAILMFAITAWNSHGYYQADEHFQIIEFANYKLGNIAPSQLTWEFSEKIRPGLQPLLFYGLYEAGQILGLDVFGIVRLSRLVAMTMALIAIFIASRKFGHAIVWLVLIWFVPTLFCRFSAENMGGIFLALALLMDRTGAWKWFCTGLFLGLAFAFRYQLGITILSLTILWLARQEFSRFNFGAYSLGAACALAAMFLADYWLYAEWVLVPWNYLEANIFQGIANEKYGVSPWYSYFGWLLEKSLILPGLALLAALLWFSYKYPKHDFTWAVLPFAAVHILIGHKELRFLFPVILPVLFMAAMLVAHHRKWRLFAFAMVLVFFPVGLYRAFAPLKSEVAALYLAYRHQMDVCYVESDPMNPFGAYFYYYSTTGVSTMKAAPGADCPLIFGDRRKIAERGTVLYQEIPEWAERWFGVGNWPDRTGIKGVYLRN